MVNQDGAERAIVGVEDSPQVMSINVLRARSKSLAQSLAAQKESIIRNAITYALKRDDWSIADVGGRGQFEIHLGGSSVFSFDGEDLVWFGPIMPSLSTDGTVFTAAIQCRLLYEED